MSDNVFRYPTPVTFRLGWQDHELASFEVNVPVEVDPSGAQPNIIFPRMSTAFTAKVYGNFDPAQLKDALEVGIEAFQKAFNEKMGARNATPTPCTGYAR